MTRRDGRSCEVRYTTKGAPVRVNGTISQEALDVLGDWVERHLAEMCKAISDVPMPEIAQRIHGRETYWCGRPEGHEGLHRWPDPLGDRPPVAEWPKQVCRPEGER